MSTQEINDKIAIIRLIHFLERELHYPNDDFVELFTQENGLTEESRDIVLNNNITANDLIRRYKLDLMGLPKPITHYLLEPDEKDKNYRLVNRERHNKTMILYIVGNRQPTSATHLPVGKPANKSDVRRMELTVLDDFVEIPTSDTQERDHNQTLTISKKNKGQKIPKPVIDVEDYSNIERRFRKINKTIAKKKNYRGREM